MNSLMLIKAWQRSTSASRVGVGPAVARGRRRPGGRGRRRRAAPRRRSARGRRRSGRRARTAAPGVARPSRAAKPSADDAAERAVQEHQGLRRGRRRAALADAHEVLGPVEEHHRRDELAPLDEEVDAPPPHRSGRACRGRTSSGRAGRRRRASRRGSARPRAGAGRAASRATFSRSIAARASSNRLVLHVDGARDDQPVQRLEPPAVADEVGGEPVEQLGVGRRARPGRRSRWAWRRSPGRSGAARAG